MQWTQKETMLLKDMMNTEQICIDKYADYAARACDPELKTLFEELGKVEQGHLSTLEQMNSGTIPKMNQSQNASSSSSDQSSGKQSSSSAKQDACFKEQPTDSPKDDACEEDEYLCRDALDTEKHTSSLYDTCIFEFNDAQARDVLNHIQKEEQEHGKRIYDYMSAHGMSA